MGILSRIFRFLFWLLVLSWSVWLLKRFLGGLFQEAQAPSRDEPLQEVPANNRRLVRDPLCGIHVAEELAIPVRTGSEVIHFCSQECKNRYFSETQRLAAGG